MAISLPSTANVSSAESTLCIANIVKGVTTAAITTAENNTLFVFFLFNIFSPFCFIVYVTFYNYMLT